MTARRRSSWQATAPPSAWWKKCCEGTKGEGDASRFNFRRLRSQRCHESRRRRFAVPDSRCGQGPPASHWGRKVCTASCRTS
jgi:hypothetical protein